MKINHVNGLRISKNKIKGIATRGKMQFIIRVGKRDSLNGKKKGNKNEGNLGAL